MTHTAENTTAAAPDDEGWEWAVVEIMGHRRRAGRVREVERFGAKMIRIDMPNKGAPAEHGWTTQFYPGSALFSFTPSDEATCLRMNKPFEPASRLTITHDDGDADGGDGDGDGDGEEMCA